MAKFNTKVVNRTITENLAGGEACKESPALEFISILLTSFVQDQYYRSSTETLNRLKQLIKDIKDKKFLAKAAIYARNEFGMRSITHAVAGELASIVKGEPWMKNFFNMVVHRPDDMMEIVAYYLSIDGQVDKRKPIPNSMKKGLAKAFAKFDEYQLSKYRGENKDVSLVDLVNLVHPKPTDKNRDALKKLVSGTLKAKDTWEVQQTQAGQKATSEEEKVELKKQSWVNLVKEKKLGYFALLRNLRNILEQAPEIVENVAKMLTDEKQIKNSLVLPFRYVTAINEIENLNVTGTKTILKALNDAIDIACNNVPKLSGETLVVLDHSGSMGSTLTDNVGKASLFGVVLAKSNEADCMIFGDTAAYVPINSQDSTLTTTKNIIGYNASGGWGDRGTGKFEVGHGTNFHAIFQTINKKYDRIVIFSDMQGWMGYDMPTKDLNTYKKKYNANPYIYSIDLAGYGTLQFPEKQICAIAGFSEKIFDFMKVLEQDRNALITKINSINL